ncbi:hypothetical protein FOL47_005085 [Perkinsus chesapeaki]|uniref:AB hydrolase-1 domain-containing protein n=1 Tax=Perkinsus chesapeaki TaxID=330153 RepID=A0A7J6LZ26_PERCH|nr:hypothetical protein FOL47_005085 [Perkinsus chesapeaki]
MGYVTKLLPMWAAAEGGYFFWYRRRLAIRNATPAIVPAVSPEQRDFVFDNVVELGRYYPDGVWRLLKGWFYPSIAQQDLKQDNLNEMLAWAFCYKDTKDLPKSEWQWVEKAKKTIADEYGYSPKPGRADVKTIRNTLDPIVSNYHPLSFYCGVYLAKAFGAAVLRLRGYHHYNSGRVKYWYRSRPSLEESLVDQGESNQEAFVFFHGIGIGLVTYLSMIFKLTQPTQFLFEMPWISMNPLAPVVPDDEYAKDVKAALKERGVADTQRLCLAGHSFGSLPIVWVKRHCPELFDRSRVVLVDPVCIYLNLPDVCLNFLYRKPHRLFMRFLRYIASEELGIACSLHREFFWMQSVLFPQELPPDSTVFLSEHDHVVPVHDVYTGCQRAGVDTRLLKGIDHGWFLAVPEYLRELSSKSGAMVRLYVMDRLLSSSPIGIISASIIAWAFAEGCFYIWFRRHLSKQTNTPAVVPAIPDGQRDYIAEKVAEMLKRHPEGLWRLLKGWFEPGVDQESLRDDNISEFLAWAFYYKHLEALDDSEREWVDQLKTRVAKEHSFDIKPGRGDVKVNRQTLDPVMAAHRPLVFYLAVRGLKFLGSIGMLLLGYRHYQEGEVTYWYKCNSNSGSVKEDEEVLVFFHGLGIGITTYLPFLPSFRAGTHFLFELPWVSMDPWAKIIPAEEYAVGVEKALAKHASSDGHHHQRLCLAGHSFGTFTIAWLKHYCPKVYSQSRVVLVDPVSIHLQLPDVCSNFLYKAPERPFAKFLRYIASQEVGIACCLFRNFFWMQCVMFPCELPEGSVVFLSEKDHVVPVKDVYAECYARGVTTIILDGIDHGSILIRRDYMRMVADAINCGSQHLLKKCADLRSINPS